MLFYAMFLRKLYKCLKLCTCLIVYLAGQNRWQHNIKKKKTGKRNKGRKQNIQQYLHVKFSRVQFTKFNGKQKSKNVERKLILNTA